MNPKTKIAMLVCGVFLASACRNDQQHTMPPTQPPPDEPGQEVIDQELAPPEDPEDMRTIPEGEAIEEYQREQAEEIEDEVY